MFYLLCKVGSFFSKIFCFSLCCWFNLRYRTLLFCSFMVFWATNFVMYWIYQDICQSRSNFPKSRIKNIINFIIKFTILFIRDSWEFDLLWDIFYMRFWENLIYFTDSFYFVMKQSAKPYFLMFYTSNFPEKSI